MRTILWELTTYDDHGQPWDVKLLGPADGEPRPNSHLCMVQLQFAGDETNELYGSDELRFPLFAFDLTPRALAELGYRRGVGV